MNLFISILLSLLLGDRSLLTHKNAVTGSNKHFLALGHGSEMCLMTDYVSYLLSGRTGLPACLREAEHCRFQKVLKKQG
jgi:hypothetical protein